MKKKIIIPISIAIVALCVLAVVLLFPKHKVDYKTSEKNTTKTEMETKIGSKPDKTTEKDGMTVNTYEHSTYMDYDGKMDYYYLDDKLMMSRWETSCDDGEEMQETYQEICKEIKKDMGDGTVNDAKDATTWSDDTKSITVSFYKNSEEDTYMVSILENELSGDASAEVTTEPTTEATEKPAKKTKK